MDRFSGSFFFHGGGLVHLKRRNWTRGSSTTIGRLLNFQFNVANVQTTFWNWIRHFEGTGPSHMVQLITFRGPGTQVQIHNWTQVGYRWGPSTFGGSNSYVLCYSLYIRPSVYFIVFYYFIVIYVILFMFYVIVLMCKIFH